MFPNSTLERIKNLLIGGGGFVGRAGDNVTGGDFQVLLWGGNFLPGAGDAQQGEEKG